MSVEQTTFVCYVSYVYVSRVVAEIDEVLGTKRSVDYEDLEKLEKTGQVTN